MNIILLGAPGAGKGTQAVFLSGHFKLKLVGTGDMFRNAIAGGTELGKQAERFVKEGMLVPDDIVIGIIRQGLSLEDWEQGLLFDGFPRTVTQAQELDKVFDIKHKQTDRAIFIAVTDAVLIDRLVNRWTCSGCGKIFGSESSAQTICTACGGKLVKRIDDTEETARKRLHEYKEKTEPVIDYYKRKKNVYVEVNGSLSKEEVAKALISVCS
ncbi:MAG: adenylate kinase [bacterium]